MNLINIMVKDQMKDLVILKNKINILMLILGFLTIFLKIKETLNVMADKLNFKLKTK